MLGTLPKPLYVAPVCAIVVNAPPLPTYRPEELDEFPMNATFPELLIDPPKKELNVDPSVVIVVSELPLPVKRPKTD